MIRGSIPHLLLLIYLLSANSLLVIIFLLHQKMASKVNVFAQLVEAVLVSGQKDGFLLSGNKIVTRFYITRRYRSYGERLQFLSL